MSDNPRLMKAKMSQSGIHCSIDWVTACMEWLAEEQPGLTTSQLVLKLQEQWLTTDITTPGVMDRQVLPPNILESVKMELPGQYTLQVQHGHDVASPAYGQLQKLHEVDLENARVSADDSQASQAGQGGYQASQGGRYMQGWEPRPSRIMMLSVTDGFVTLQAMEHQVVKNIPDMVKPGMKVQVLGPITVRRGIMMLTSNSIRVLGGEVEELQEQFSLVNILQQKIGKEDVGQKGNMFATQSSYQPPVVRPLATAPAAAPIPTASSHSVPIPSMDDMSDDDDMLLLAASQVDMTEAVTSTQESQPRPIPQQGQPRPRTQPHLPKSAARPQSSLSSHPSQFSTPVGVVHPLRTLTPSNTTQNTSLSGPAAKKMKSQASITSFMVTKSNTTNTPPIDSSTSTPSFSLLDSDDEFLSDLPLSPSLPPRIQTISEEPFHYLMNVKAALQSRPESNILAKFKVVSSTLASKMSLKKTVSGPQWQVAIMLNDGSDSIKAHLSPELLDKEIGPANQHVSLGTNQQHVKAEFKERMKLFSVKLAELSCLVTIKFEGETGNPTIVKMEEITGLHTALMRKRRLL